MSMKPALNRSYKRRLRLSLLCLHTLAFAWVGGCNSKTQPDATEAIATDNQFSSITPDGDPAQNPDTTTIPAARPNMPAQTPAAPLSNTVIDPNAPWITPTELPRETWDIMFLGKSKIGSMHTQVTSGEGNAKDLLRLKLESLIRVNRGGQLTQQKIEVVSKEKPNGELVEFLATLWEGQTKTEVTGTMFLDSLVIQSTQSDGKSSKISIPWKAEYKGPFAVEQSLKQQRLKEGEIREYQFLSIPLFRLAKLQLKGGKQESIAMLDGSAAELQEVTTTIFLDNNPVMESVSWVDAQGETLKSAALGLQILTYRGNQSMAESVGTSVQVDLLQVTSIALPKGTSNLHQLKSATFQISAQKDPFKLFSRKTNQTIRSTAALDCEVTVHPVTPEFALPEGIEKPDLPTEADSAPTAMIQSDDPAIVAMAARCCGEESDPWKIALALEKCVHDSIERKDFSKSFASASEVAKELRGDCTEHSVLLAALLRAKKIPARVASGLVYVETADGPMMGYHMWNEAYIGERWIPLDAVLGQGGIGAGHLKILESSLPDQNPYVALLPVLQVLGELKISSVTEQPVK